MKRAMTAPLSAAEARTGQAMAKAGLHGWKLTVCADPERAGFVAILTSPDYRPLTSGRMVSARGLDPEAAITAGIVKAAPQ